MLLLNRLPLSQITPEAQPNVCLGISGAKGGKFVTTACNGAPTANQLWTKWSDPAAPGVFYLQNLGAATVCFDMSAGGNAVSPGWCKARAVHGMGPSCIA
jgi:hypothetical protein